MWRKYLENILQQVLLILEIFLNYWSARLLGFYLHPKQKKSFSESWNTKLTSIIIPEMVLTCLPLQNKSESQIYHSHKSVHTTLNFASDSWPASLEGLMCEKPTLKSNSEPWRTTGWGTSAEVFPTVSTMYATFGSFNLAITASVARCNIFSASEKHKKPQMFDVWCLTLSDHWQIIAQIQRKGKEFQRNLPDEFSKG